jgi:predicted DNA-binding ribbon-helix-helix protein
VACFASRLIHVNAATQHICLLCVIAVGMTPVESAVKKRSVVVDRRKTSTSLENEFWEALRDIAQSRQMPLSALLATIKVEHQQNSLSSAIRVFVLNYYRKQ